MTLADLIKKCCGHDYAARCPSSLLKLEVKPVEEYCICPVRDYIKSHSFEQDIEYCNKKYKSNIFQYFTLRRNKDRSFTLSLVNLDS